MSSITSKMEQSASGLLCAAVSDVGMRRTSNQDSLAISLAESQRQWQTHGHLFMVADGMGAHAAGELASKLAVDTVPHSYHKQAEVHASEAIVEAVREANAVIFSKGSQTVDFQGMGTTCSCLLLLPGGGLAAHVGDSRIYRLRGSCLEQLTFDHSLVWEMAAAGHANEEDVPAYVPKNVITRSLGPHPTVSVDIEGPFSLQTGDRFLLCSDGLTGPLKPDLIGAVLGSLPLSDAAQTLVDLANLLGGPDNITTVVVEITDARKLGAATESVPAADSPRRSSRKALHPGWWVAMLVCAILVGVTLWQGHYGGTLLALAGLLIAVVVAVVHGRERQNGCPECRQVGLQGKAPYRIHDCSPGRGSIDTLGEIVRQLEDLQSHSHWEIDWTAIQQDHQTAHEAIRGGNYPDAVTSFCSAVRRMMQAVREAKRKSASDSTVDLA
jgi:protein phosphatase